MSCDKKHAENEKLRSSTKDGGTAVNQARNAFTALLEGSKKPVIPAETTSKPDLQTNAEKGKKRKARKPAPSCHSEGTDDQDNSEEEHIIIQSEQTQKNRLDKFLVPVKKFPTKQPQSKSVKVEVLIHGSPGKTHSHSSDGRNKRPKLRKRRSRCLNDKETDSIELISSEILDPLVESQAGSVEPKPESSTSIGIVSVSEPTVKKTIQSRLSFAPREQPTTGLSNEEQNPQPSPTIAPAQKGLRPAFSLRIQLREGSQSPGSAASSPSDSELEDILDGPQAADSSQEILDTAFSMEVEPSECTVENRRRSSRIASRKITVESNPSSENEENIVVRKRKSRTKIKTCESESDEIVEVDSNGKKMKIASIFSRSNKAELARRKALEAQQDEAKRKFLMSGLPEIVKIQQEIIYSQEPQEEPLFPHISHVKQVVADPMWNLPYPESLNQHLKPALDSVTIAKPKTFSFPLVTPCLSERVRIVPRGSFEAVSYSTCQQCLTQFSTEHLDLPIYSVFFTVLEKHKRPDQLWTEKYRPRSTQEVLGQPSLKRLETWLKNWVNLEERQPRRRKRHRSNSDSDFDDCTGSPSPIVDEDCNTFLISGPSGVGKSVSVYALAETLGFTVLEINASSRRNQKSILAKLQEATQSHRLQREGQLIDVVQAQKDTLTLLLFEDVDVTFEEEDEGFWTALSSFMASSKRPIILTTTSRSDHLINSCFSKLKGDFRHVHFCTPSPVLSASFLWSVCFVEGVALHIQELRTLCINWECDLRKCLLHLQYCVRPLRSFVCQFKLEVQKSAPNNKKASKTFKLTQLKQQVTSMSEDTLQNDLVFTVKEDCDSSWKPEVISLDLRTEPNLTNISPCLASVFGLETWVKPPYMPLASEPRKFSRILDLDTFDDECDSRMVPDKVMEPKNSENKPNVTKLSTEEQLQFELLQTATRGLSDLSLLEVSDIPYWRDSVCVSLAKELSEEMINCDLSRRFQTVQLGNLSNSIQRNDVDEELLDLVSPGLILSRNACNLDVLPTLRTICKLEECRRREAMAHSRRAQRFIHYLPSCSAKLSSLSSQTLYF